MFAKCEHVKKEFILSRETCFLGLLQKVVSLLMRQTMLKPLRCNNFSQGRSWGASGAQCPRHRNVPTMSQVLFSAR